MPYDEIDQAFAAVEEMAGYRNLLVENRKDAGPQIGVLHDFLRAFRTCPSCEFHPAKSSLSELHSYTSLGWTDIYRKSGLHQSTLKRLLDMAKRSKWVEQDSEGRYSLTEHGRFSDVYAEGLMPRRDEPLDELIERYRRAKAKYEEQRAKQGF